MLQTRSWLPRTEGSVRLEFARRGERTDLRVLHQAGAARARFPSPAEGAPPEAVLLNMAGGLTGGDRWVHWVPSHSHVSEKTPPAES